VGTPLVDWLQASWPAHDWARAELRASCFHDVALLAPDLVARVARHGARPVRLRRQHAVLAALAGVRLPFAVPRNASGVVARAGRAGMLTTWAPGEPRLDVPWTEAAGPAAAGLRAVDVAGLPGRLPAPPGKWRVATPSGQATDHTLPAERGGMTTEPPLEELARLRAEVQELRRAVGEFRERVAAPPATAAAGRVRLTVVEVERLTVVEPDGTVRLVLSNRARSPDAVVDGAAFKRAGPNPAGLLFSNDEGDECGGLIYGGQRRAGGPAGYGAGASLLFDQFKQDQAVGLRYDDRDGERSAGLFLSDWKPAPALPRREAIARWEAVRDLPAGPERTRGLDELRAGRAFPARRVFVGRERDGAAAVRLCDAQGRVRLRLRVAAAGTPRRELLDEAGAGAVVAGLPAAPAAGVP
jgi:hypothetical protein